MKILAIDTSHPVGSVSFQINDSEPKTLSFGTELSHLVELGESVATLLDGKARPDEIDRVALVIGPGSFTGLRIGMAYTKGLYAALGVDVVMVGTLELLALPLVGERERVCCMVDARKSEVYAAIYGGKLDGSGLPAAEPGGEARAVAPAQLLVSLSRGQVVCVGSGAARFRREIEEVSTVTVAPDRFNLPSTEVLCRIGTGLSPLTKEALSRLEPDYIRPSDAKLRRIRTHGQRHTRSDE